MSVVERLTKRLTGLVAKALVNAVVDTGEIQLVKVSTFDGTTLDGVERLQPYGDSSSPPPESEAIVVNINGSPVVIVCDSGAYRVTGLASGEKVVYSMFGQRIHLKADGSVEITAPGGVSVGNGSDAVAMAAKVDALWSTLYTMFSTWAPPATPDSGAALKAAFTAAFPSSPSSVASTNLEAD